MKVLVTGSLGYIGSEIVKYLDLNNIVNLGIDKRATTSVKELSFNMTNRDLTFQALDEFSPDFIIHCGTFSAIAYRDNFLQSFREDAETLINILENLKRKPDTRLIYYSSSYVYSGLDITRIVKENSFLRPDHNFGLAKHFFENLITRNHPNTVFFRLASVFGPGKSLHPNVLQNMIAECIASNQLTVWGRGVRRIQFTYIEDVVRYAIEAFTLRPGIYNLGGDEFISIAETAESVANLMDSKLSFDESRAEGETLPQLDIGNLVKASNNCGITPLSIALTQYVESFKDKRFR